MRTGCLGSVLRVVGCNVRSIRGIILAVVLMLGRFVLYWGEGGYVMGHVEVRGVPVEISSGVLDRNVVTKRDVMTLTVEP